MFLKIILIFVLLNIHSGSLGQDATEFVSPVLSTNKKPSNLFSFAGKTYYVSTVFKANFHKALQFCRQQGMQLFSISSKQEDDRIAKYLTENGMAHRRYWTSGTNLADRNQWIWLSTGQDMSFTNWYATEPSYKDKDNTEENCVEYLFWDQQRGFAWNDNNCKIEFYFICESAIDCPTSCKN